MDTVVGLVGLTHPHTEMYLETLEALDEVSGVVLVDRDESAGAALAATTLKFHWR